MEWKGADGDHARSNSKEPPCPSPRKVRLGGTGMHGLSLLLRPMRNTCALQYHVSSVPITALVLFRPALRTTYRSYIRLHNLKPPPILRSYVHGTQACYGPGNRPAVPVVVMLIPTLGPWWWRGRSTAGSLWKAGVALGSNFSCMYTASRILPSWWRSHSRGCAQRFTPLSAENLPNLELELQLAMVHLQPPHSSPPLPQPENPSPHTTPRAAWPRGSKCL